MSGESDLFDDVEQASDDSLTGSDTIYPGESSAFDVEEIITQWASDLTYDEVHSFIVGFAPMFSALILLGLPSVPSSIPNTLLTLALVAGGIAILGIRTNSKKLSKYVRLEPHYLIGGQAIAAGVGVLCLAVIRSVVWLGGVL